VGFVGGGCWVGKEGGGGEGVRLMRDVAVV